MDTSETEHQHDVTVASEDGKPSDAPIETSQDAERRLRRDVARLREQARSVQAEREVALLSMRAENNLRLARSELRVEALRAGIIDLDALRLVDAASITVLDDGSVEGASDAITSLRSSKPYLFGVAGLGVTPVGTTSHTTRPPAPTKPEPVNARTLTREQWQSERARLLGRSR